MWRNCLFKATWTKLKKHVILPEIPLKIMVFLFFCLELLYFYEDEWVSRRSHLFLGWKKLLRAQKCSVPWDLSKIPRKHVLYIVFTKWKESFAGEGLLLKLKTSNANLLSCGEFPNLTPMSISRLKRFSFLGPEAQVCSKSPSSKNQTNWNTLKTRQPIEHGNAVNSLSFS